MQLIAHKYRGASHRRVNEDGTRFLGNSEEEDEARDLANDTPPVHEVLPDSLCNEAAEDSQCSKEDSDLAQRHTYRPRDGCKDHRMAVLVLVVNSFLLIGLTCG